MQHRLPSPRIKHVQNGMLIAMSQYIIEQFGLPVTDQTSHSDGRVHIRHRIVGVAMLNAIRRSQVLEPEGRTPVIMHRPLDTVRSHSMGEPNHVDNVPPGVAILPFPGIGITEISVKRMACHLVIKTEAVVPDSAGARLHEQFIDTLDKLRLWQALVETVLGRDTSYQGCTGVGNVILSGARVQGDRVTDDVEVSVRTYPCELRGSVVNGIGSERLVIMPEKGLQTGFSCSARRLLRITLDTATTAEHHTQKSPLPRSMYSVRARGATTSF